MHITDRVSSGVLGLDSMLFGGYPEKSVVMVAGGPGSGKTVLSLQYTNAALLRREPVVYVNIEEPWGNKKRYCHNFGWDMDAGEKEGLLVPLDYQFISTRDGKVETRGRNNTLDELSFEYELVEAAKRVNAKHIVLDPLNGLMLNARGAAEIRYLVHRLFETIRELDYSALFTYEGLFTVDTFYSEMFLSDGVIALTKDLREFQTIKTIHIDKMRGIDFDDQPRRYMISNTGMVVFDKEPVLV